VVKVNWHIHLAHSGVRCWGLNVEVSRVVVLESAVQGAKVALCQDWVFLSYCGPWGSDSGFARVGGIGLL